MLAFAVASFGLSFLRITRYRRRGEPLPWYFAGNLYGAASLACLVVGQLLIPINEAASYAAFGLAMGFLAFDVSVYVRAKNRAS